MSAKPEKKSTTSWADEADDEEPVVQQKPAWAKLHSWGTPAASASKPAPGGYDKNFPPAGDFPPVSASTSSHSAAPSSAPSKVAEKTQDYPQRDAPRSKESDDFRGNASSERTSSNSREERSYPARDYPSRDREVRGDRGDREERHTGGDREGSFRRSEGAEPQYRRESRDDYRGGRREDRGGYGNRRGGRDDFRGPRDETDADGFHTQGSGRRGGAGRDEHERSFDSREGHKREDRSEDRRGGNRNYGSYDREDRRDDRRGGDDRREDRNEERREGEGKRYERREAAPVPFPETAPFVAYVSSLSYEVSSKQLQEFFEEAGNKVENVRVPSGAQEGQNKGFAYVEFADLEGLKKAVEMAGSTLAGRSLRVSVAEPMKERPKLNLAPRSVPVDSEDSKKSSDSAEEKVKSNPFGAAKPRDELAILQKKEEERKQREQKQQEEKPKEESKESSEVSPASESKESTTEKPKREDQKLYVPRKEGGGSSYKSDRPPRKEGDSATSPSSAPSDKKPFERSERGGFNNRGRSDRGRKEGGTSTRGRGGFRGDSDRSTFKKDAPAKGKDQPAEKFEAKHANPFDALGEDEE